MVEGREGDRGGTVSSFPLVKKQLILPANIHPAFLAGALLLRAVCCVEYKLAVEARGKGGLWL